MKKYKVQFHYETLYHPQAFFKMRDELSTRHYAIAHQSMSRIWHYLYDDCEELMRLVANNSSVYLNDFQNWLIDRSIDINWQFHIWFILWAKEQKLSFLLERQEVIEELVIRSLLRWNLQDLSMSKLNLLEIQLQSFGKCYLVEKQRDFKNPPTISEVAFEKRSGEGIRYYCLERIEDVAKVKPIEFSTTV